MVSSSAFMKALKYLQDSNLVYAFQKYFGVERIDASPDYVTNGNTNHIPSNDHVGKNILNGESSPFPNLNVPQDVKKPSYIVKSKFWYYLFSFGTSLGYELFYATFFSYWAWNLNTAICRRVVNVWVFVMYIGQALKDIICWPRPSSPPAIHMEPKYVEEYGMPSTHAMVSFALPFSIMYFGYQRYQFSLLLGLLVAVVWCTLVCCSRLYMGMHTLLDIIGGLLLSPLLMLIYIPVADAVDQFQMKNNYSPLLTILIMVILQILYPKSRSYTPARGDTSVIMGTGTGFAVGTWFNFHIGVIQGDSVSSSTEIMWPGCSYIVDSVLRMAIGLSCIVIARTLFKPGLYKAVCYVFGLDPSDVRCRHKARVEMPYKFMTYVVIGFVIISIAPHVFKLFNVERISMYVES